MGINLKQYFLQLLNLCEAESLSYLDEVASTPASLDLAKSIALEVCPWTLIVFFFSLLKLLIQEVNSLVIDRASSLVVSLMIHYWYDSDSSGFCMAINNKVFLFYLKKSDLSSFP